MGIEFDDDPDFDDEEGEDESFDCGMTPDGSCQMAGTEECDWECPFNPQSAVNLHERAKEPRDA